MNDSIRNTLFRGAFALWLGIAVTLAQAQVPLRINYQGYLTNSTGVPVNVPTDMTVRLYDQPIGGSPVFEETHAAVPMANGAFNIVIGSVQPLPLSVFDTARHLSVQVGGDAEMVPRQELVSSPYALRAASADSLSGAATIQASQVRAGTDTLIQSVGIGNFFAGVGAGNAATTGSDNTATGDDVLVANTTGVANTASGAHALRANTTGSYNTASGRRALFSNTTGLNNAAHGNDALLSNTTGQQNTATGSYALKSNTTGNYNTATGSFALWSNTSGLANTATGLSALNANTTGEMNTATGAEALRDNTTGYNNTAAGVAALQANTIGYENAAAGYFALSSNTTGYRNSASGSSALGLNTSGHSNTATGAEALGANSTGRYNTASGEKALYSNATGNYNTASGAGALFDIATGEYNTPVGFNALLNLVGGTGNTVIGAQTSVFSANLTNATALGWFAIVDGSNRVRIGNTSVTQIGGQVGWTNLSDLRDKKDVRDIAFGLDFVKALRPVEFRMLSGNERIDFGFIAQDVEALIGGQYNVLGIGGTPERKLSLRYTDFIAPMVKAMQEQQAEIDTLKARIERLEGLLSRTP